jgi:hypothetical protein
MSTPSNELPHHKDSFSEEVWSRGSLADSIEFKSALPISLMHNDKIKDKPNLFRYEQGGIVVYTSNARIAGDDTPLENPICRSPLCLHPNSVKKALSTADPRGTL